MSLLLLRRMKFVEPIRDRKEIEKIKNVLRGQECYSDLWLFVIGILRTLDHLVDQLLMT